MEYDERSTMPGDEIQEINEDAPEFTEDYTEQDED